jgi:hypothetical protein
MNVNIQLPDEVYANLLKGNKRIRGSIALVNPKEGNFNPHRESTHSCTRKFLKLPHGKVSINEEDVRLSLRIAYAETSIPGYIIESESRMASSFINLTEDIA